MPPQQLQTQPSPAPVPVQPATPPGPPMLSASQMDFPKDKKPRRYLLWGGMATAVLCFLLLGVSSRATVIFLVWLPFLLALIALGLVIAAWFVYKRSTLFYIIGVSILLVITIVGVVAFGILTKPFSSGKLTVGGVAPFSMIVAPDYSGRKLATKTAVVIGKKVPATASTDIGKVSADALAIIGAALEKPLSEDQVRAVHDEVLKAIPGTEYKIVANKERTDNGYLLTAYTNKNDVGQTQLSGVLNDVEGQRSYFFASALTSTRVNADIELDMVRSIKSL